MENLTIKRKITDYTINTLIKDNLEYTVLSKSTYFMTATSPLQKKFASPGTLSPEEVKKTNIICSHRKVNRWLLRTGKWEVATKEKREPLGREKS